MRLQSIFLAFALTVISAVAFAGDCPDPGGGGTTPPVTGACVAGTGSDLPNYKAVCSGTFILHAGACNPLVTGGCPSVFGSFTFDKVFGSNWPGYALRQRRDFLARPESVPDDSLRSESWSFGIVLRQWDVHAGATTPCFRSAPHRAYSTAAAPTALQCCALRATIRTSSPRPTVARHSASLTRTRRTGSTWHLALCSTAHSCHARKRRANLRCSRSCRTDDCGEHRSHRARAIHRNVFPAGLAERRLRFRVVEYGIYAFIALALIACVVWVVVKMRPAPETDPYNGENGV
jgi:hypothetical protein